MKRELTLEEHKQVLQELRMRLAYDVYAHCEWPEMDYDTDGVKDVVKDGLLTETDIEWFRQHCGDVKLYLRPLSSITPAELEELKARFVEDTGHCYDEDDIMNLLNDGLMELGDAYRFVMWMISKHFDMNGMIGKGLALPAKEHMYKGVTNES